MNWLTTVQAKGVAMPDYSEDARAEVIVQPLKEYPSVLFLNYCGGRGGNYSTISLVAKTLILTLPHPL